VEINNGRERGRESERVERGKDREGRNRERERKGESSFGVHVTQSGV